MYHPFAELKPNTYVRIDPTYKTFEELSDLDSYQDISFGGWTSYFYFDDSTKCNNLLQCYIDERGFYFVDAEKSLHPVIKFDLVFANREIRDDFFRRLPENTYIFDKRNPNIGISEGFLKSFLTSTKDAYDAVIQQILNYPETKEWSNRMLGLNDRYSSKYIKNNSSVLFQPSSAEPTVAHDSPRFKR